jgi:hypothetical protein
MVVEFMSIKLCLRKRKEVGRRKLELEVPTYFGRECHVILTGRQWTSNTDPAPLFVHTVSQQHLP